MTFANLDQTVKRTLLEKGLPVHFYAEVLFHQSAAVRELAKDTLQIVNVVNLPINSYGAIDLPPGFMDDVALCAPIGQELMPIPKKGNINPLRLNNPDTGAFDSYSNLTEEAQNNVFFDVPLGWFWFWNTDSYGEPTGRFFGANGGVSSGYKIIRERRQIQLTEDFIGSSSAILMFISNGQSVDNATQIDYRAFGTIQAYSNWKLSPNADIKDSPQARTFYNEKRLLRAAMSDLDVATIKNILRSNFTGGIKN